MGYLSPMRFKLNRLLFPISATANKDKESSNLRLRLAAPISEAKKHARFGEYAANPKQHNSNYRRSLLKS